MSGDQLRRLKELEKESERRRRAVSDLTLDKQILKEAAGGTFQAPAPPPLHRSCLRPARDLGAPACRVLGQHRSTQRRIPRGRADEERLVADMIELARQSGRY